MREIIFRGKRLDNEDWTFGDLLQYQDSTVIHTYEKGCRIAHQVDTSTTSQYTGLTDKNGKRIFEGDIIRFREYSKGKDCWIGVIEYDYGSMYVIRGNANEECCSKFEFQLSRIPFDRIEIIGNIFDNPEILGGNENVKEN